MAKIFERVIYNRMLDFLNQNSVINQNQFGFTSSSNTLTASMHLTGHILNSIDKKMSVITIFIDLSKAFDSVDHSILIEKMRKLHLSQNQLDLFQSYLSNRPQYVKAKDVLSSQMIIKKGVPQGSILGPLLFNLFINDIFDLNLNGHMILYADDIALTITGSNFEDVMAKANYDLSLLSRWFDDNLLKINVKKTNYVVFERSNRETVDHINIQFNGVPVQRVYKIKYLGLVIDSKLNWHNHIDTIIKSITPYIFALKRSRPFMSESTAWMIYHAYIHSKIMYLNPIWNCSSQAKLKEIAILQNRTFKIIKRLPNLHPTKSLYSEDKLPLEVICKMELLLLIFKIKNNLIKCNEVLVHSNSIHNYPTRNATGTNYYINHYRTNHGKNNVICRGLTQFNLLPEVMKCENCISSFKRSVLKYLFSQYLSS